MPETTNPQTAELAARLEAVLTERFTELGNPFSEMRRQEKGPDGWPASHPVGPHHVAEVLRELLAAAPASPSAPAEWSAAADVVAELRDTTDVNVAEYQRYDFRQRIALSDAESRLRRRATELRRLADEPASGPSRVAGEAQQDETQGEDEPFGTGDCTCIPFVREGGTARYCRPGDTVDQISGWERGLDCPHHRQPAVVSQPGKEA